MSPRRAWRVGHVPIVLFAGPAPILFTALGFVALRLSDAKPVIVRWEGVLLGLTVAAAIGVIAIQASPSGWRYLSAARRAVERVRR